MLTLGTQFCVSIAQNFGHDHESTLLSAGYLADAHRDAGNLHESERLQRDVLAASRRVNGEEHFDTLEARVLLADLLVQRNKLDEARALRDSTLPTARRVLGPDHRVTRSLAAPDFLDPPRF